MDAERLFPVSKPILCEEKSVSPFFEVKCCRSDYCNKYVRFELPRRGEMTLHHFNINTHTHIHKDTKTKIKTFIHSFEKSAHILYIQSSTHLLALTYQRTSGMVEEKKKNTRIFISIKSITFILVSDYFLYFVYLFMCYTHQNLCLRTIF